MGKCKCEHPERKPEDGKCCAELIEKCHGEEKEHPCCCDEKEKKE